MKNKIIIVFILLFLFTINSNEAYASNKRTYIVPLSNAYRTPFCYFIQNGNGIYFETVNNQNSVFKIYEINTGNVLGSIAVNGLYKLNTTETNLIAIQIYSESDIRYGCKLLTRTDTLCLFVSSNDEMRIYVDNIPNEDTFIYVYGIDGYITNMFNINGVFKYSLNNSPNEFALGIFSLNMQQLCSYAPS